MTRKVGGKTIGMFEMRGTVMKASSVLLALLVLLLAAAGNAEVSVGGRAGAYLRLGVGVRAIGMGGAFTAISDDASASYWNPAGLARLDRIELNGMYSSLSLDRQHNFAGFAYPFKNIGTVSLSCVNLGMSEIEGRNDLGELNGSFSDNEMAFGFAYAKSISSIVSVGIGAKYLNHTLADNHAKGYGFDAGILANVWRMARIGICIQNIGAKMNWDTDSNHEDRIPITGRIGASVSTGRIPIIFAADLVRYEGLGEMQLCVGAEYRPMNSIWIRTGYAADEFAAGASIQVRTLQVDYAYAPDRNLDQGTVQRIGLSMKF